MSKKIVIIACVKFEYLFAAWNLAVSLKYHGSTMPITLLVDPALNHRGHFANLPYKNIFDEIIPLKGNDVIPFYNKTRLFELVKADQVIYLDADSLCISNPDHLFDELKGSKFSACFAKSCTRPTAGQINMSWANVDKLYYHYEIPQSNQFTEINSSFIYWEKEAENIFKLAEHFYAQEFYEPCIRLGPMPNHIGHYPDEVAFEVATAIIDHRQPEKDPMYARYNHKAGKVMNINEAAKAGFCFITLPGNAGHSSSKLWKQYDVYARRYQIEMGVKEGNKSKYIPTHNFRNLAKAAEGNKVHYKGLRMGDRPVHIDAIIKEFSKLNEMGKKAVVGFMDVMERAQDMVAASQPKKETRDQERKREIGEIVEKGFNEEKFLKDIGPDPQQIQFQSEEKLKRKTRARKPKVAKPNKKT